MARLRNSMEAAAKAEGLGHQVRPLPTRPPELGPAAADAHGSLPEADRVELLRAKLREAQQKLRQTEGDKGEEKTQRRGRSRTKDSRRRKEESTLLQSLYAGRKDRF